MADDPLPPKIDKDLTIAGLKKEIEELKILNDYWSYRCGFAEAEIPIHDKDKRHEFIRERFLRRHEKKEPLTFYIAPPSSESLKKLTKYITKIFEKSKKKKKSDER